MNLGFNRGAALVDPERLLVGSGARIRHIRIGASAELARPGVRALVRAAVAEGREGVTTAPAKPRAIVRRAGYTRKRRPK